MAGGRGAYALALPCSSPNTMISTRKLRYSNCGHPPALLLRGDDGLERPRATCTVVGLFDKWDCAMEERQLAPGMPVLLYTDGDTEARNDEGEEFGEERLLLHGFW
jgi:serine phosphatase RsbU (regulator of sigma subunit)